MSDEQLRVLRNRMFDAMGPNLRDTEESRAIESEIQALRAARITRVPHDIVGDMYLRAYA